MSKGTYVNEICAGSQRVAGFFGVKKVNYGTTSSQSEYMTIELSDKTGTIEGKVWDVASWMKDAIKVGKIVFASGEGNEFRGKTQLKISNLEVRPNTPEAAEFLPVYEGDTDKLWSEVIDYIKAVTDPTCRMLLRRFLEEEELVAKFKIAPGACNKHHAYIHGLMEHTHAVMSICQRMGTTLYGLDYDLLMTGAFFHDVGKIWEYDYSGAVIKMSESGRIFGHIPVSFNLLSNLATDLVGEARDRLNEVSHMILAHHGQRAWGSPVVPQTPEALMLHYADNMDAKMRQAVDLVNGPVDADGWTPYNKVFEGSIRRAK